MQTIIAVIAIAISTEIRMNMTRTMKAFRRRIENEIKNNNIILITEQVDRPNILYAESLRRFSLPRVRKCRIP